MKTLLVVGATSDIARATALEFALQGWNIILAGRNIDAVKAIALDIEVRTAKPVATMRFDACDAQSAIGFWSQLSKIPDALLCAVGMLGDQDAARTDMDLAYRIIASNFTGLVPLLSSAASTFEERGHGLIIGISSVAGDRGRQSNYVYGSAKAGMTAFLSGLRQRLAKKGVHVLTVKPGFVATAMTEGLALPAALCATPQQVASDIGRAVKKKKDVIYTRWFWRYIMLTIEHIPNFLFKKTNI